MERAKLIALRLYLTVQGLLLVGGAVTAVLWWSVHRDGEQAASEAQVFEVKAKRLATEIAEAEFDAAPEPFDPDAFLAAPDDNPPRGDTSFEAKGKRAEARARAEDLEAERELIRAEAEARAKHLKLERNVALLEVEACQQAAARAREREEPLGFFAVLLLACAAGLWVLRRWLRWLLKP